MSETRSVGYWGSVWQKLKKDKLAMAALSVIILLFAIAVFQDFIAGNKPIVLKYENKYYFPVLFRYSEFFGTDFKQLDKKLTGDDFAIFPPVRYSPTENNLLSVLTPPSKEHLFGTDDRGRDVLSRMIHGARISLSIGFVAVGIAAVIGIILGGIAGYYGGTIDFIVSRLFEVMMTFPVFFLILTILAFRDPSIYNIMIVIGATSWTGIARLIRGQFLQLRKFDYVDAAVALGGNDWRVMMKHMLPNSLAPVLVDISFGIAGAILVESGLSFLSSVSEYPLPSLAGEIYSHSHSAMWISPGGLSYSPVRLYL